MNLSPPSLSGPTLLLAATVLAAALASALAHGRDPGLSAAFKMTAATGYLALALVQGATESAFGRVLLAGLALCWLGDLLLIPEGKGATFLGGLGSFLLGHVAYAAAFLVAGVAPAWAAWSALPVVAVGGVVLRWLWGNNLPSGMRLPVLAYVAAISVMVALAFGAAGEGAPGFVAVGAVAFMASDIFVARERFVSPSSWNTWLGLPLYFVAQLLLAAAA